MKNIDHALQLAELGFRIFPLSPRAKVPPKDFAWKEEATRDPNRIREWWAADPNYNVGVATGDGTIVVDADTKKGKPGMASLEMLDMLGLLPQSYRVSTPSGGMHVYLKVDESHRNRVDSIPDYPGIDIRSDGGYVVGPGSTVDGKAYTPIDGTIEKASPDFESILLATAPTHSVSTSKEPIVELDLPTHVDMAIEYLTNRAPEATEGAGGNETTYQVAARCREYGLSQEKTLDVMLDHWNEQKAFPAWLPADLQTVVANAYKYATGAWGGGTPAGEFDAVDIGDIGEAPSKAEIEKPRVEWPEPVDLWAKFPPPELPRGLLPKVIEEFALVQGETMGADPGGLAAAALAVCAAAIPDQIKIRVKKHNDAWHESARIWVALVGDPSTKKSPVMNEASRPMRQLDGELVQRYVKEKEVWDALKKEEQRSQFAPRQTRALLEDATTEAAAEVLRDNPQGLLCFQDELSGWFGAMEKYGGKGAGKDRAFWLQAFNGGSYSVNRISRGVSFVPNLSVCLLGGIQPDTIRRHTQDGVDDGLLQRLFPIVLRPATVGADLPKPPVTKSYQDLVNRLRFITTTDDGETADIEPQTLVFTAEAHEVRSSLEIEHHALLSTETVSRKLASHIGKLDGLFARLCVIWHAIEFADAGMMPSEVTKATAEKVAAFMRRFLRRHSFAFYTGVLGLSEEQDELEAAAGYVLAHPEKSKVTWRDIGARGSRLLRPLDQRAGQRLLEKLEFLGWLRTAAATRNETTPRWAVNPRVHELFAERARVEIARREQARETIAAMAQA